MVGQLPDISGHLFGDQPLQLSLRLITRVSVFELYPGQLEILDICLTSVVSLPYFNPAVLQMEVNALILENADNL